MDVFTHGTTKASFLGATSLLQDTLKVYTAQGGTLAAVDDDYTLTNADGLLTITIKSTGILASDLKVDWYLYDAPLAVKRNQVESSIMVHRRIGTKGSVAKALSDIYPGSTVLEWNEYGGRPYYFRLILDLTDTIADISNAEVLRTLNIYKPLRSEMEDDMPAYRSSCIIAISLKTDVLGYDVRRCGTPLDSLVDQEPGGGVAGLFAVTDTNVVPIVEVAVHDPHHCPDDFTGQGFRFPGVWDQLFEQGIELFFVLCHCLFSFHDLLAFYLLIGYTLEREGAAVFPPPQPVHSLVFSAPCFSFPGLIVIVIRSARSG